MSAGLPRTPTSLSSPLDNQLRRLFHERQLRFARTAPFITGVQFEGIAESTIQEREHQDQSVVLTQQICSNLRRQLSVLNSGEPTGGADPADAPTGPRSRAAQPRRADPSHPLQLMHLAEQLNLLRYGVQLRLKGEPDNEQ